MIHNVKDFPRIHYEFMKKGLSHKGIIVAKQPVAQISFCCLVPSLNLGFIHFTASGGVVSGDEFTTPPRGAKTAEIEPRGSVESSAYSAISEVMNFCEVRGRPGPLTSFHSMRAGSCCLYHSPLLGLHYSAISQIMPRIERRHRSKDKV